MDRTRMRMAALALPLVVLGIMIVRAELIISHGRQYTLPIEGYDPRDLLRGHYLRYRVVWNGPDHCRDLGWDRETCGVCFVSDATPHNPRVVLQPAPTSHDECQAFIRPEEVQNLNQYFIPEDMGAPLEAAIRNRRAELVVSVSNEGAVVITDLLLDGRPWRDVVGERP